MATHFSAHRAHLLYHWQSCYAGEMRQRVTSHSSCRLSSTTSMLLSPKNRLKTKFKRISLLEICIHFLFTRNYDNTNKGLLIQKAITRRTVGRWIPNLARVQLKVIRSSTQNFMEIAPLVPFWQRLSYYFRDALCTSWIACPLLCNINHTWTTAKHQWSFIHSPYHLVFYSCHHHKSSLSHF